MKTELFIYVVIAAFAAVGIEEFLKNFIRPKKTVWYAVIMLPLSVLCFLAAYFLPAYIIGSILTVGFVQICYQTLIQGFQAIVKNLTNKINSGSSDTAVSSASAEGEK